MSDLPRESAASRIKVAINDEITRALAALDVHPDVPDYTCPQIDALRDEIDDIRSGILQAIGDLKSQTGDGADEVRCDLDRLADRLLDLCREGSRRNAGPVEEIRRANDALRESGRSLAKARDDAVEVLEQIQTEMCAVS